LISPLQRKLSAIILCISFLVLIPGHAKAQTGGIGPTKGQVVGVVIAIVAVGVAIGVGVTLAVHHHPSITGCAAANGDSLTLLSEDDRQSYALSGDIAAIKAGERVRLSGKKRSDRSGNHMFEVLKVSKDYGPCHAAP
jgi:hypothetical protein